jgi:MerR family transcriptional regulator, light-induced transcriptional regulator
MRTLTTGEAAAILSVSPNTLRMWEQRFQFPRAMRSPGNHRRYLHGEVTALASALRQGLSISSAVSAASDAYEADVDELPEALASFSADRADRAMEASLVLRSLERSLEEVLLPALTRLRARHGTDSATFAFAQSWATEWLRRAQHVARREGARSTLLVGDATQRLDPARASLRALELLCIRAGLAVVTIPVTACERLEDAVAVLRPRALVVAGSGGNGAVGRWLHAVQQHSGKLPVAYFQRRLDVLTDGYGAIALADSPADAHTQLLRFVVAKRDDAPR